MGIEDKQIAMIKGAVYTCGGYDCWFDGYGFTDSHNRPVTEHDYRNMVLKTAPPKKETRWIWERTCPASDVVIPTRKHLSEAPHGIGWRKVKASARQFEANQ